MAELKDSGNRRTFESGAVRDMAEGKGRCDLLPLDIVSTYLIDIVFLEIAEFQRTGDMNLLYQALYDSMIFDSKETSVLEAAKQFEDGARKYGDDNWKKGIPVKFYIDSAVRHYLKYKRGDTDEPHDRAFAWNILCALWTIEHKPELNDYAKENSDGDRCGD